MLAGVLVREGTILHALCSLDAGYACFDGSSGEFGGKKRRERV